MTGSNPFSPDARTDRVLLHSFVRDCQVLAGNVPFAGAPAVLSQFRSLVRDTPNPKSIFAQALMEHCVLQFTLRLSPNETLEILKKFSPFAETHRPSDAEKTRLRIVPVGSAAAKESRHRGRHRAVECALAFIERHFTDSRLRLARVAAHVGLSRSHLDRLLTKESGTSFVGHLRQARLRRASELLAETPLSIKEIAAAVGYDGVSTFDRNFKQIHACSPRQWRIRVTVSRQETITKSKIREDKTVDSVTPDV